MFLDVVTVKYGQGKNIEEFETMVIGFFDNSTDRDVAIEQARNSLPDCRVWVNIEELKVNTFIQL